MANLVYYHTEKITFKTSFEKQMTVGEAEIVFKKLIRHFKLGQPYLNWTSGRNHPRASQLPRRVTLNVNWNNFGCLCHELAHIKQMVKYKLDEHTWHNKRHLRYMKSMVAYCEKKHWFEAELDKRLAVKPAKPEPTPQDLKVKLIARLEKNCKRYQSRVKLYQNKLKKAQKKIERIKKGIVMGNSNTLVVMGITESA